MASALPIIEDIAVGKTVNMLTSAPSVKNWVTQQRSVSSLDSQQHPIAQLQSVAPTPIKLDVLTKYLSIYPVMKDRIALLNGFTHGFRLGFTGTRSAREAPCLKSAIENPDIVKQKLDKELKLGRIAGPFRSKATT